MPSFNSMFLNADIIIFFVKTVYGKLYAQQYYEGEVSVSKYYLQEDYYYYYYYYYFDMSTQEKG